MGTTRRELLEYETLGWSQVEELKDMLTIRTEGNVIYICHPKHVLDSIVENPTTKDVIAADFESINVQKMIGYNDFGHYSMVEQVCSRSDNQMTYLLKRAQHMLKKYREAGVLHYSCPFAIIEKLYNGGAEPQYLVRGIVSCRQDGFSIASNPLAMRQDPNESVWQKGLHFGDN